MANPWVRLWLEMPNDPKWRTLSEEARTLADLAHEIAYKNRTCYPNWRVIEEESGLSKNEFMRCFEELCDAGIIFSGFPSLLVALADRFPLIPMYGPIGSIRPSPSIWRRIRAAIFKRDDYTCQYCGARGVRLECDHVFPVSKGGHHGEENLVTACFDCNRSKRDKTVEEWKGES